MEMSTAKILHVCNSPINTNEVAIEYHNSAILYKDIYLYITCIQLPQSIPSQKKRKSDSLDYVVINNPCSKLTHKKNL